MQWNAKIFVILLMIVVALPRFNRNQLFIKAPSRDDAQYQLYVRYFRGEPVVDQLRPASTWRPLVPMAASVLPFDPMTALSVTNLLCLALALLLLIKTLSVLGLRRRMQVIGSILFAFSFPTFYYATIGYVDPGGILALALIGYLTVTKKWILAGVTLAIGAAAKEGVFVGVPVVMCGLILDKRNVTGVLSSLVYPVVFIAATMFVRSIVPGDPGPAFWSPGFDHLLKNLMRSRAWLSGILTFGPVGVLLIWLLLKRVKEPETMRTIAPFLAGATCGLGIWLFAFLSAPVDGRTLWCAYPFAIPAAMMMLRDYLARTSDNTAILRLVAGRE